MARPPKEGLDYFPLDVDIFEDEKIEAISGEFGIKGEITVVKLLCAIYKNGYFIVWNELVKAQLLKRLPGVSKELLDKIIDRLVLWEFFDKTLFHSAEVLTSKKIQENYFEATKRRKTSKPTLYIIKNNKCEHNVDINAQAKGVNVDINAQSKVKERISPPPHAREGGISGIRLFSDKSLTECYGELKANIPWMEQFCMNIRLDYPDFTPELFYGFLDRFFRKLQNEGEIVKSPKDAMSHFANWLNIELEKLKKDGSRTSKNHPACGSEPVSVTETLCPKEGADASPDLVKNWIDGLSIGG